MGQGQVDIYLASHNLLIIQFDGKYSAQECEGIWRNVLHPSINKEAWTKEEDEKLIQLVEENHLRNWKDIAEKLGVNQGFSLPSICFSIQLLSEIC